MPAQRPPRSSASIRPGLSGDPRPPCSHRQKRRCQPCTSPAALGVVDRRVPHQRAVAEQPDILARRVGRERGVEIGLDLVIRQRSRCPAASAARAAASSEPSRSALAGDDDPRVGRGVVWHRRVIPRPAAPRPPAGLPRRREPWRYRPDISAKRRASHPPSPAPARSGSGRSAPAPSRSSRPRRAA